MRRFVRAVPVVVALVAAVAVPVAIAPPARAAGEFRFVESSMEATEDEAIVRVLVQRTDLPVARATVGYRTEAGTAGPGEDYAEDSGNLVFAVGETSAFFTVFLRDDEVGEEKETVLLRLLDSSWSMATLTIVDDDGAAVASTREAAAAAPAVPPTTAPPAPGQAQAIAAPAAAAPSPARTLRRTVVARAGVAAPRRVNVRQSPVTPFELRPAPQGTEVPGIPADVDPLLAVLAGLLLARVAAEVWFRSRSDIA